MLQDRVPVVRRFSGGGTVIVDSGTIFVTFICNKEAVPNVQPYPRPIMSWSSLIYDQVFRGFVDFNLRENGIQFISIYELIGLFQVDLLCNQLLYFTYPAKNEEKKCCIYCICVSVIWVISKIQLNPSFFLLDYVFGDHKFGGNAQSITKNRWIHHTSFLWDYEVNNMAYLKLPKRVPEYRSVCITMLVLPILFVQLQM